MSKKILILRFSEDITQAGIIDIQCQAIHYGMTADEFNIKTERDLDRALKNGNKYDYLYIAGHGNDSCIGDERGIIVSWENFGKKLCVSRCLNDDSADARILSRGS